MTIYRIVFQESRKRILDNDHPSASVIQELITTDEASTEDAKTAANILRSIANRLDPSKGAINVE